MNLNEKFDVVYQHYQDLINSGKFHGDMYDKIDGIMQILWESEDSAGAIFDHLDTDDERKQYIQDFRNACEWLISWGGEFLDDDYQKVADDVLRERS
jgi:hypothetical protein